MGGQDQEDVGGYLHGSRVQEEERQRCRGRYLEVDVGAGREDWAELGILLDGPPLAGSVLEHATAERLLLLRRPLLLRRAHRPCCCLTLPCGLLRPN